MNNNDYKWQKKDTIIVITFCIVAGLHIVVHIVTNGFTSIGALIEQMILILFAFIGWLEVCHDKGWDVFVPGFMIYKEKQERTQELREYMDNYFVHEINFIKDYSEEKTHYIMSQLGITAEQFEQFRIELVKMRCLPLATVEDAQAKIKQYIRCGDPFVADLSKLDSSRCTYSRVKYYLNFYDSMYISSSCRELTSIMSLLIREKVGISNFDKIVIPHDSNFILGVEVGKQLQKPVVHMRQHKGRIEKEKCWDGKLAPIDKVVIVHDVLVTAEQIIHAIDNLPRSCQVVRLCCFVAREEWDGIQKLADRKVNVERILDLNDHEIENLMK